jgi:hypothetical protein
MAAIWRVGDGRVTANESSLVSVEVVALELEGERAVAGVGDNE